MLRKLLFVAAIAITTKSFSQVAITPIKTTENKADAQIDYKEPGAPMPDLKVLLMHDSAAKATAPAEEPSRRARRRNKEMAQGRTGGYLTNRDLNNGANLFIMMFNPTCSHCVNETEMLEKNISLFKRSKLVLLAKGEMQPYVPEFIKNNHTDDYPGVLYVGIDSSKFVDNVFLYRALPQINVYNHERKLIKVYTGDVPIDSLQKFIQ